jgi:AhpD family alkylhydroperoxidase
MSRIEGVSGKSAGPITGAVLWFARRKTAQLAGRETDRMIEPLEAYAHAPRLMLGYGMLEQATAKLDRVEPRLKVLAELKAATLTQCEYCIDIGSQIARRAGVSEQQLRALPHYRKSEQFDELERLVLDYAVGMSRTPVSVSDELFSELRAHFDEAQLVELTNVIAVENMRGRFNLALDIGAAGFSEGMVCAVPEAEAEGQAAPVPAAEAVPAT